MTPIFRARRATAFDRLYRQHVASVYRYAHAVLGNRADAEDVTQQTFLNAYRAWAQGTKPRKAENWLLTIAHNEVRRHFRKASARSVEVEYDDQVAQPAPERVEPSVADVLRALQHLPATQREALVMREFEGRSYAEIAEILDVTQSALEALIFRARRSLAEQLEEGLTCAEAEQALSRRLDGRLRRREARALKRHLGDCPACSRFEQVQKEQRSLLGGLALMPVPASLYLLKGESAAAALGITTGAATAGGVGGGALAGAGVAGVATGVAAKAVAVTAVVAVAGGVGYGVATEAQTLARADRPEARAVAVVPKQERRREVVLAATEVRRRATLVASPIRTSTPRSGDAATTKTKKAKPQRVTKAGQKPVQRSDGVDAPRKLKLKQEAHSAAKAQARAERLAKVKAKLVRQKAAGPAKAKANVRANTKATPKAKATSPSKAKTKTKAKAAAQPKAKANAESKAEKTARPETAQKNPEPAAGLVAPPDEQPGNGVKKNAGA